MSYDYNNVFAKILRNEIPCKKIYEDEMLIAFEDKFPSAPVHVLVIPKGPYRSFDEFTNKADPSEISNFFIKVKEIAHLLNLHDTGYRIISNHGSDAEQTVEHFHLHILGKKSLGPLLTSDVKVG